MSAYISSQWNKSSWTHKTSLDMSELKEELFVLVGLV